MHFSSRLIFSLLGVVAAVSLVFAVYQATLEMPTFRDEVQKQSLVLAESQRHTAKQLLLASSPDDLQTHVDQFQNQEQLAGIALYDATGRPLAMTSTMTYVQVTPAAVIKSLQTGHVQGEFLRQADLSLHVLALPLSAEARLLGAIAIFHKVGLTGTLLWRLARMSVVQTLLIVDHATADTPECRDLPSSHHAMAAGYARGQNAAKQRTPEGGNVPTAGFRGHAAGNEPQRGARYG